MWGTVSTWAFSLQAAWAAAKILSAGGNAMDAAEEGIKLVESDLMVEAVGRAGFPNERGELELDAAIMNGDTLKIGAVAGVKGFEHPISIARAVMEHTRHSILVGAGAEEFGRKMGFEEATAEYLVPEFVRKRWEAEKKNNTTTGHDTIGMITLDPSGLMVAATSTSGAGMKMPGRVGDAPIVGSGFYVESGVGGAAATGMGEDIMRTCCSFRAVELMRGGMNPQQAAETVVRTAHEKIVAHGGIPNCIALVCLNAAGECGGSANHKGFWYACARTDGGVPNVVEVIPVIDRDISYPSPS